MRQPMFIMRSTDGGDTFGPPEKAFAIGMSGGFLHLSATLGSVFTLPIVTVDEGEQSRFRDRIYAVWDEVNAGQSNIWLTWSADKGKSWAEKVRLNDNAPAVPDGPLDYRQTPVVSVSARGVVGVSWYDRRDDPARRCWKYYFTASLDGGATWLPNVPVSTAPSCPARATNPRVFVQGAGAESSAPVTDIETLALQGQFTRADSLAAAHRTRVERSAQGGDELRVSFNTGRSVWPGHYTGLTADTTGTFHALWADRRGPHQHMYTVRIEVALGPDSEPPGLRAQTVTDLIQVIPDAVTYHATSGVSEFTVRLRNVSPQTIHGPLTLRVKRVTTAGTELLDADGGGRGVGARWDFTARMGTRARLAPGMMTEGRAIRVRTAAAHGLDGAFEFDVLGRTVRQAPRAASDGASAHEAP